PHHTRLLSYSAHCSAHHRSLPPFPTRRSSDLILEAIGKAGYSAGDDILLGLDVASSEFFDNGKYSLVGENKRLTSEQFVDFLARSEEHTSELQSRENLVCRLLLEKKKMYLLSW